MRREDSREELRKRGERGKISASSEVPPLAVNILGIGEITTTIEVKGKYWGKIHPTEKRWMRLAYKRLPLFESEEAVERYLQAHNAYQNILNNTGVPVPWHDNLKMRRPDGKWVVYNRQERFPLSQVACLIIRRASPEAVLSLFRLVMARLERVFTHNQLHPEQLLGFDGQISNWVLPGWNPSWSAQETEQWLAQNDPLILYIDTTTPLLRLNGVEQLDPELFLKSVPASFRPLIRRFLLHEVLDRYYRPRDVILDLVASFLTHHRPDMVPALITEVNRLLAASTYAPEARPFTLAEIHRYHRQDVMIWYLFRSLKRLDRYVSERFFGRPYEQRLPPGSPRHWKNLVGAGGRGLSAEEED